KYVNSDLAGKYDDFMKEQLGDKYDRTTKKGLLEATKLLDNDAAVQKLLLKLFGHEGNLTFAESLAYQQVLALKFLKDGEGFGSNPAENPQGGFKVGQLRMMVELYFGNAGDYSMGGGKTYTYLAVFGMRTLMGEEISAHLIVSQAQEIEKFVTAGGGDM